MEGESAEATSWVDRELAGSTFRDKRLGDRLRILLARMSGAVDEPIPLVCQDWAGTKAAYRFLSNEAVSEAEILRGHFEASRGVRQPDPRRPGHDGVLVSSLAPG